MRLFHAARLPLVGVLLVLLACSEAALDPDAGAPGVDAMAPLDADLPDSGVALPDSGAPDAATLDAAMPECGPFETWDGLACVDLDECAVDNGGCGDARSFTCENQDRAPPECVFDETADFLRLTDGVQTIDSGGALPSSLVVHGDTAFGVVFDESERAFIAAARVELGRVVVFGHEAHLGGLLDNASDLDRLASNAILWTTHADAPVVGAIEGFADFLGFASDRGYTTSRITIEQLDEVDLLVVGASRARSPAQWQTISEWVRQGGGLLVAGQAWYWSYSNDNTATEYPANVLLNEFGVTYTPYSHVSAAMDVVSAQAPGPLRHAKHGLGALSQHVQSNLTLSLAEQQLAVATVTLGVDVLPVGPFTAYFARARAFEETIGPIVIMPGTPLVRAEAPLAALAVVIATKLSLDAPADEVRAHAMAESFPGAVPAEAPRITAQRAIDASHTGLNSKYAYAGARAAAMRSTGLYAAPGDVIIVRIPSAALSAELGVRIGAHTDTLWNKDEWARYPRMAMNRTLATPQTRLASGLGGPIYITIPVGTQLGSVDIEIEGAVAMPYFELGVTDSAGWAASRQASAPWAELVSHSLVMTVPRAAAVALDDPQALLRFWDSVLDADAALSGFSSDRPRRERFVFDRQISAGWMHSGYPIMAHLASVPEALDLGLLNREGSWGLFHELGHNHQWRDWVLPGTTEANVNLFSVYAMETVVAHDRSLAHSALSSVNRSMRIDSYLASGPDFAQWSVWTALETYLQLQEAFGWAPLTQAITAYRSLPSDQVPSNDAERIDAWMVQMSQATGRDLSGFFLAWGHPLRAAAIADVAGLPPWTDHPMVGR